MGEGYDKGRVARQWGQPELCGGLHLTPVGTTRPPCHGLRCAPPKRRSCAALRPVKALFCLTCGWVVLRTRPLIVAFRGPDPSTHAPDQAHAVAALPYFADLPMRSPGLTAHPRPADQWGPRTAGQEGGGYMSIDEAIKLANSVVSLLTAVIALLSTRNALLTGKRSRAATRKRKRKARK